MEPLLGYVRVLLLLRCAFSTATRPIYLWIPRITSGACIQISTFLLAAAAFLVLASGYGHLLTPIKRLSAHQHGLLTPRSLFRFTQALYLRDSMISTFATTVTQLYFALRRLRWHLRRPRLRRRCRLHRLKTSLSRQHNRHCLRHRRHQRRLPLPRRLDRHRARRHRRLRHR